MQTVELYQDGQGNVGVAFEGKERLISNPIRLKVMQISEAEYTALTKEGNDWQELVRQLLNEPGKRFDY